ncbi:MULTISPECIES: DUF3263 domain-containing protein [unclassified Microcella]|uniref:DUF3263 domain-containing protein n=1 Tax=unclassified Microcella TaxID=2630066 RepID=UPI00070178B7|nr:MULTISPECIES: DUF3263 domain-containing protein [unclassified Microcella]KQV26218.1 hypothetical protein ASC54_04715 [Yonghaparkia sp. Root332]KRF32988.1 hypothetical protein ASG83_02975 [Yonghaparkia sp. Soil809]
MTTVPDADRIASVLEFERRWWGAASGRKEVRIRQEFGWSPARYYQVLNALLDEEAAVRYDPVLVGRLREVRATRAELRRTRRPGTGAA